jgi:D-arginine dehydrogenase
MTDFDFVIVGAGIAGASLAAELACHASVLLIEAEAYPGYHATGRSVAFWTESYGGPGVQPLTTASGSFFLKPPTDFADQSFITPRGCLHIGTSDDEALAHKLMADFKTSELEFEALDVKRISSRVPGILPDWNIGLWEAGCCDIDAAALHAAYLRKAKRDGGQLHCLAPLRQAKFSGGLWKIETATGNFTAKSVINAAGAWADQVAILCGVKPVGIVPYRRTVLQLAVEPAASPNLPLVIALDGSLYFKPAAGRIWLSPHDETPSPACDAMVEEIDVAIALERLKHIVDWKIERLEHKWAGLRSFAADRLPVIGRDPDKPEFFWFAGQGGFGIQTAPAAASLAASLLCEGISAPPLVDSTLYAPDRLH